MNKFYSFSFFWKAFGNRVWKVPGFNILGFKKINSYLHLTRFVPKRTVACLSYQKDDKKCKQRVACFSICLASQCQQYWISKCILKALNVCLDNLLFGLKYFWHHSRLPDQFCSIWQEFYKNILISNFSKKIKCLYHNVRAFSKIWNICGRITV